MTYFALIFLLVDTGVARPLVFRGKMLSLNLASSAAGQLRVELQDASGTALLGFTLADCDELFCLAGKPIHLRVVLREADLSSLRFAD
jgi:hypothetical protein